MLERVCIDWLGRRLEIEYRRIAVADGAETADPANAPVMVFLHEGLGSVATWKNFPETLCRRLGMRGLVFSRFGYGGSTPRPADERFPVDFMQRQADEVLPTLFKALNIERPWLFGHSDGGSIALLHAARPDADLRGIVVVAPHIFVEDLTIDSIRAVRETYLATGLRERLGRFHADVDSAFWGWNDVWLDPQFRTFNIEAACEKICCPILAIQGEDDEYGTLEQIRGIERRNPRTTLAVLPGCGHSPQRDAPEVVIETVARFIMQAADSRNAPAGDNNKKQHQ
jgi:pimeloyl-ACP methyl ester carboxylesterase